MKKRLLSLALCLVLVVGLFSGLTVALAPRPPRATSV